MKHSNAQSHLYTVRKHLHTTQNTLATSITKQKNKQQKEKNVVALLKDRNQSYEIE